MTATTTETLPDEATTTRLLQRQIMPLNRDMDVLSLYVDTGQVALDAERYGSDISKTQRKMLEISLQSNVAEPSEAHPDQLESRERFRVPLGERVSFGT